MRPRSTLRYIHRSYLNVHTHVASLEGLGKHEEAIEDDTRAEPEAAQDGRPLAMSALEQHVREERDAATASAVRLATSLPGHEHKGVRGHRVRARAHGATSE